MPRKKRNSMPAELNEEQMEYLLRSARFGTPQATIAEYFDVSVDTYQNWLKRLPDISVSLKQEYAKAVTDVLERLYNGETAVVQWLARTGRPEQRSYFCHADKIAANNAKTEAAKSNADPLAVIVYRTDDAGDTVS